MEATLKTEGAAKQCYTVVSPKSAKFWNISYQFCIATYLQQKWCMISLTSLLILSPRAVVLVPGCIHVSRGQDRGPCVETVPGLPGPVEQVFWVSGEVTSRRWTWCCQGTCTTLPVICRLLLIPIALLPDAPPHPSTTQPHYTLHTPTLNPHILPLTGAEQYYCHYHNQQWSNCHDSDSIMIVTCLVKAS